MTQRELDHQLNLALLYLDHAVLCSAISEAEYVDTIVDLFRWHERSSVSPERAIGIDTDKLRAAMGWSDNVVALNVIR